MQATVNEVDVKGQIVDAALGIAIAHKHPKAAAIYLRMLDDATTKLLKLRAEKQKMTVDQYIDWRIAELRKEVGDSLLRTNFCS